MEFVDNTTRLLSGQRRAGNARISFSPTSSSPYRILGPGGAERRRRSGQSPLPLQASRADGLVGSLRPTAPGIIPLVLGPDAVGSPAAHQAGELVPLNYASTVQMRSDRSPGRRAPHTLTRGTFGTELPGGGVSLRRGPDGLRRGVDRRFALTRRGSPNFSCRGFTGPSG